MSEKKKSEKEEVVGKTFEDIMVHTEPKSDIDKLLDDQDKEAVRKLKRTRLERLIAEEDQKLNQVKIQKETTPTQASNYVESLFAGRTPEEIKSILGSLGQDEIQKLALLANASNPNSQAMLMNVLGQKGTSVNDTVQLVKTIVEMNRVQTPQQQGITLAGMASLITALDKRNKQSVVQKQTNPLEAILKATLDELKEQRKMNQQQEMMRLRKEMADLKSRPSAMAEIAGDAQKFETYKKMFGGGAKVDELTLKLEDMRQRDALDHRKLDYEERRLEKQEAHEAEKEGKMWDAVKSISEGPIGQAVRDIGGGAADRVRGGSAQQGKQLVRVQCPSCKGIFAANPELSQITCPQCGETLSKEPPPQSEPLIREVTPQPEATEKKGELKQSAKESKT